MGGSILPIPLELIEAARTGEGGCVERLIEEIWPHAFRIALSIVGDKTLAEDAAQESCVIVFRAIASLKSAAAFKVWLYRIVSREALRLAVAPRDILAHPRAETDPALRLDVIRALHRLERKQRAVIVLHYYVGMNSTEIARVLGISSPAVRFRLMCARSMLAKHLRYEDASATEVCNEGI